MVTLALTNARVIDPLTGHDAPGHVVVADRAIVGIDTAIPADAEIIDCGGRIVAPALIDAGVFAADAPACLAGGIARVVLMPDRTSCGRAWCAPIRI